MPRLLVRNLNPMVLAHLKERAALHGRSLRAGTGAIQGEVPTLPDRVAWLAGIRQLQDRIGARPGLDSLQLLRESRDER